VIRLAVAGTVTEDTAGVLPVAPAVSTSRPGTHPGDADVEGIATAVAITGNDQAAPFTIVRRRTGRPLSGRPEP